MTKPLLRNKAASRRLTRLLFFSDADRTELRRRINATWLPEKETVADFSQGVQGVSAPPRGAAYPGWRNPRVKSLIADSVL